MTASNLMQHLNTQLLFASEMLSRTLILGIFEDMAEPHELDPIFQAIFNRMARERQAVGLEYL